MFQRIFDNAVWTNLRAIAVGTLQRIYGVVTWTNLRSIGLSKNVRYSSISILVIPLIVKTFASVPNPLPVPFAGKVIPLHLEVPFSWEVTFFAAVFFTIAGLIFTLRCPEIVKDFATYREFRELSDSDRLLRTLFSDMQWEQHRGNGDKGERAYEFGLRKFVDLFFDDGDGYVPFQMYDHEVFVEFGNINRNKIPNAFQFAVDHAATARTYSLWMCGFFYSLGFLALGWILFSVVCYIS